MADSAELARALAVCDAVLAHRLPGWEEVMQQVEAGMEQRGQEERIRQGMLARTRVDFALLSEADEDRD